MENIYDKVSLIKKHKLVASQTIIENNIMLEENVNVSKILACSCDVDIDKPIEMSEAFLLPSIHHAGLPEKIAMKDFEYEDSWKIGVKDFQDFQNNKKDQNP